MTFGDCIDNDNSNGNGNDNGNGIGNDNDNGNGNEQLSMMRHTCQALRPERNPTGKMAGFASTRRPVHPCRSSKA